MGWNIIMNNAYMKYNMVQKMAILITWTITIIV